MQLWLSFSWEGHQDMGIYTVMPMYQWNTNGMPCIIDSGGHRGEAEGGGAIASNNFDGGRGVPSIGRS